MGYVELVFRREGRFLRWCARKRLHEQHRSDPSFRSMFTDEARLAGLIRHPNAVGVLDVGADADGPFFIMEFVEGVSLSRVVAEAASAGRAIPMQIAVRVCFDAARGLHAAHEVRAEDGTPLRLVHRDVSPQNILIGFDGTVRVTDFGIAKALGNSTRTSAGVLKGNMGYLAPEQLRFEEPDRRSDLFSLGVTLYEMLSGQRLYPNTTGFDGTRRILSEPAPDIGDVRSDVPPELCELLFELLAKERESRPPTAAEVALRLEGILAPLIAEEGSITVGDYMDQHFGSAHRELRGALSAHLVRIESQPAIVPPAIVPPVARPRRWWAATAAGFAVAAVVVVAWQVRRLPRHEATPSRAAFAVAQAIPTPAVTAARAGVSPATPPRAATQTAPATQTATATVIAAVPEPPSKSRRRLPVRSARSSHPPRVDTAKRASAKEQGHRGGDVLSVPLFDRWQ